MNYIQAPYEPVPITYIKCKAPRIKRAKRSEAPPMYRKNKLKQFITFIKKGIKL